MKYVCHICKRCGHRWVDKDLTQVITFPPTWKLCEKCCKELGIDFKKQKPKGKIRKNFKSIDENNKKKNDS